MHNKEAVIWPGWSIHSGVGTGNDTFIWGMCGENQDFDDLDGIPTQELLPGRIGQWTVPDHGRREAAYARGEMPYSERKAR